MKSLGKHVASGVMLRQSLVLGIERSGLLETFHVPIPKAVPRNRKDPVWRAKHDTTSSTITSMDRMGQLV